MSFQQSPSASNSDFSWTNKHTSNTQEWVFTFICGTLENTEDQVACFVCAVENICVFYFIFTVTNHLTLGVNEFKRKSDLLVPLCNQLLKYKPSKHFWLHACFSHVQPMDVHNYGNEYLKQGGWGEPQVWLVRCTCYHQARLVGHLLFLSHFLLPPFPLVPCP